MPSSSPLRGRRDLGAPIFSATSTRRRPSQVPEAGPPTTIMAKETDSASHNNLEDVIQNPYTNQQPSTGDAVTTHTLQPPSIPNPHACRQAHPRNDEQQSSGSDSNSDKSKKPPKNDTNIRGDHRRQHKTYLLRLRRSQRQPQPTSMTLLTDTLSSLTTTDAPAAPPLNPREANLRRLHRENSEKLARQRARNREMNAERAARRRREVERRIQSGEKLTGGEGAGASAGGLGIADGFGMF